MPLVIDTYSDYFFYLQYRRRCVESTVKANKLALSYFSSLYGNVETNKLTPTYMVRFYEQLTKTKRLQKNDKGKYELLSQYSIYKIMVKLRAYIKWLGEKGWLGDLKPIDVPVGSVPRPLPKYIEKEDIKKLLLYLDRQVNKAGKDASKIDRYSAYLNRAIIRFLYTTGLRNAELRNLKMHDINLRRLTGQVLGKGNKFAAITFSEKAGEHLKAYLEIRQKTFPLEQFTYLFTPYRHKTLPHFSEQGLNDLVKTAGIRAGIGHTNCHKFRHSLATHLVQDGFSVVQVRDKLRHSSLTVTNMYVWTNPIELTSLTKSIDTAFKR